MSAMIATISSQPIHDNSLSNDHRDAVAFSFTTSQTGQTGQEPQEHAAIFLYDPEFQPVPSLRIGDQVYLHGHTDQYGNLRVSHFVYAQQD